MREIKFRAWSGGKMMYWNFGSGLDNSHGVREADAVMQFTGLKDKNGKEIYEGDILVFEKEVTVYGGKKKIIRHYWEVFFSERGQFRTRRVAIPKAEERQEQRLFEMVSNHAIVGNIYENAELLK